MTTETNQPVNSGEKSEVSSDVYTFSLHCIDAYLVTTSATSISFTNILSVPEGAVEHKAYHSKHNACSGQDGENDSGGESHCHLLVLWNAIVWNETS